jgi:cephalosporin-C deacetylase
MDSDAPQLFKDQQEKCEAYYDVMNFSPDITCPVMMNSGLIDPISPPSGVFAIFNRISSKDKTMMPMPGFAHDWYPEFDRRAWKWLDKKLNNK